MKKPNTGKLTGWVGVDLDGTLAEWDDEKQSKHRWDPSYVGKPIAPIVGLVHLLLDAGYKVKIFTAREAVSYPYIHAWLKENLGQDLEITNIKDYGMIVLFDDRAVQVESNTGRILGQIPEWLP